jgi:hypothetical protein
MRRTIEERSSNPGGDGARRLSRTGAETAGDSGTGSSIITTGAGAGKGCTATAVASNPRSKQAPCLWQGGAQTCKAHAVMHWICPNDNAMMKIAIRLARSIPNPIYKGYHGGPNIPAMIETAGTGLLRRRQRLHEGLQQPPLHFFQIGVRAVEFGNLRL